MIVHNASASASFHECQIETVLTSMAGGGPAGSGSRSVVVGVMVGVTVNVVDGNTVGVTVSGIKGVAPGVVPGVTPGVASGVDPGVTSGVVPGVAPVIAVAGVEVVDIDTGVSVGMAVACGGG